MVLHDVGLTGDVFYYGYRSVCLKVEDSVYHEISHALSPFGTSQTHVLTWLFESEVWYLIETSPANFRAGPISFIFSPSVSTWPRLRLPLRPRPSAFKVDSFSVKRVSKLILSTSSLLSSFALNSSSAKPEPLRLIASLILDSCMTSQPTRAPEGRGSLVINCVLMLGLCMSD